MIKKLLVGLLSFSATLACGITTLKTIGNDTQKVDMSNAVSSDDMIKYEIDDYGSLIPADRIYNISSGHQVTWAKK